MIKEKSSWLPLVCWYVIIAAVVLLFAVVLMQPADAKIISFKEQYQDFQGTWHPLTSSNIIQYPLYIQNGTYATRMDDSLALSIIGATYNFQDTKISVTLNYTPSQLNSISILDGINWYIPIPESIKTTAKRFEWDNLKPIVINDTGQVLNDSDYWYARNGSQLRFYYDQTARTYGIGSKYVIFQFNSYVIANTTTAGWTTANVSLNGSRWTDDGSLAINLRNDSQLNMTGLVGYWSFDEASGTAAHQVNTESGAVNVTNQGTLFGMNLGLNNCTGNCSGWNSSGRVGNGLSFDGVNDYVDVGNNTSLNLSGQFTVSLWWNSKTNSVVGFAISDGNSGSNAKIGTSATGKIFIRIINGGSSDQTINAPPTNQFNKIVVTRDSSNKIDLYINNSSAYRLFGDVVQSGSFQVNYIGSSLIASQYFNGTIDEVSVWNRTLSASEIAVLYNTSMRTQAMPLILNQTAAAGNIINQTRIVYSGQDSINNASIYARQNGTTAWTLIQANVTNNSWYNISLQFSNMDFGIQLNGNGSNTSFFTSLEYDEMNAMFYKGINLSANITSFSINYNREINLSNDTKVNLNIIPSSLINVIIPTWNTAGDYNKIFIVSGGSGFSAVVGDNPPNTNMYVTNDGTHWYLYPSNDTGYISFSSGSSGQFEVTSTQQLLVKYYNTQNETSSVVFLLFPLIIIAILYFVISQLGIGLEIGGFNIIYLLIILVAAFVIISLAGMF